MLEEKISASVKSFTRSSATPYLVAAALALGVYGCGSDNCVKDADCPVSYVCITHCQSPRDDRGMPVCNNICSQEVTSGTTTWN